VSDLEPGHYVTTDFLQNKGCKVIAGPFPNQDEARERRTELEASEGHHSYFLEQVRPSDRR
jgi:hypothetical protein